jgi:hypothetical protein
VEFVNDKRRSPEELLLLLWRYGYSAILKSGGGSLREGAYER